ncbi:response regulator [Chitinibacter bivalviorum]|uniref:Chemotaxis protein CheA n=1 Tax=Chitinibacter bivalviorum TaxID=2739434 RepID=A0A7H9BKC3_9NEIS|nr:hybrid sensor histidine kinase/response regulator [Chitinibacter bivalviorum]QLG89110.1 response regulator [Chitinibacter bivalviorum]
MLAESSAALLAALATAIANCLDADHTDHQAALLDATTAAHQLGELAEQAGQTGFWSYCSMLAEQLASCVSAAKYTPPAHTAQVLIDYLAQPAAPQRLALLELLANTGWPTPMPDEELQVFAELLQQDAAAQATDAAQCIDILPPACASNDLAHANDAMLDDSSELLASLAAMQLKAAEFEDEHIDVFSLLDEVGQLVQQDWQTMQLADLLLALSLAAQAEQKTTLDALCQQLDYLLAERSNPSREALAEQLPLLLLDALMSEPDQLTALIARAEVLFAPAAHQHLEPSLTTPSRAEETHQAATVSDTGMTTEPAVVGADMLQILSEELETMAQPLADVIAQLSKGDAASAEGVTEICELIERLTQACYGIGMPPLGDYLATLSLRLLTSIETGWNDAFSNILLELTQWLGQYCAEPQNENHVEALLGMLMLMGEDDEALLASLRARLLAQEISAHTLSPAPERQKIALLSDVSLAVPDDISAELMEGLLQELPVQAGAFAQAMQKVVSGRGSMADLDIAKRAAHTLKGAANTVGIAGVANLTHHLEDILIALSEAGHLPGAAMANLLTEAGDCLEGMAEALMGSGPVPSDSVSVFQRVLDLANLIDIEGINTEGISSESSISNNQPAIPAGTPIEAQQEQIEAMVRIPAKLVDEMLNLLGESIVSVAQMRELLSQSSEVNRRMRAQNQNVQQLVGELEQRIEVRSLGIATPAANQDFDALEFESYNELHSISRRLTEATTDSRELGLETESLYQRLGEAIEAQHRLQVNNQEVVMRTRMVPVSTIEAGLQRAARQTARLLDKDVALDLHGEHTLVDSHLLNTIVDPLMHVLRNAIDHGIETPELRLAKGKPEQGQIRLAFAREGNSIVVRCKDDGAGLDLAAIRSKAERLGLIDGQTLLSQNETARLILRHGFSIRDEASQVSGRGIGMDIVLSTVNALKGNLVLHTEQESGLQIEMRFPVSLVASHALLIESQQQRMAISTSGILDLAYFDLADVHVEDEQRFIQLNEHKVPLIELETLFGLPVPALSQQKTGLPAIVLQLDSGALKAVQIQRVIDSRDIVVKDLGQFVPRIPGMLGATVLGDGGVASVVDLRELLDSELIALNALHASTQQDQAMSLPRALVIDDSISARRATTQFMRDSGFEVRPALDGLDAIEQLENWTPDIVLVDMEMPRMNGLELAAYFRAQPHLQHIPIIMITSRSTEKHRRQAELSGVSRYLVKPFNDEQLMQQVMDLMEEKLAA